MTVKVALLLTESSSWPSSFAKMDGLDCPMTTVQPMTLLSGFSALPALGPSAGE